jgi:hypothetical protein
LREKTPEEGEYCRACTSTLAPASPTLKYEPFGSGTVHFGLPVIDAPATHDRPACLSVHTVIAKSPEVQKSTIAACYESADGSNRVEERLAVLEGDVCAAPSEVTIAPPANIPRLPLTNWRLLQNISTY